MKKNVYEILDEFKAAKNEHDRRKVLVDNATPDFIAFLQLSFSPKIKFWVKEAKYKPSNSPAGMGYTNMGNAIKKSYLFIEDHPKRNANLTEEKAKVLLTQILESLEAREAAVYLEMLNKKVKVPYLTLALLEKTFPGFLETPVKL